MTSLRVAGPERQPGRVGGEGERGRATVGHEPEAQRERPAGDVPDGDRSPSSTSRRPRPGRTPASRAGRRSRRSRRGSGRRARRPVPSPAGRARCGAGGRRSRRGRSSGRSASSVGRASATSAAAPATTAAAALEPVTVAKPRPPASAVTRPTPGATRSGFTLPSKATPPDEKAAMSISPAFGSARACDRSSVASPASAACAASAGSATTGTVDAVLDVERAGREVRARRRARRAAPASAALRTRRSTAPCSAWTTTALPATRLTPSVPKKSPRTSPAASVPSGRSGWASVAPATEATSKRAAACDDPAEDAHGLVQDGVVADAKLGVGLQDLTAGVERPDRQRLGRRGRRGHGPEPRPGPAVVPDRGDDERPELRSRPRWRATPGSRRRPRRAARRRRGRS